MAGQLHIFKLGDHKNQRGQTVSDYEITLALPESSFLRTVEGDKIEQFLRTDLALPDSKTQPAMASLAASGKALIADVEISENDAAVLGMEQEPDQS
jgi:hypothetical protein